MNKLIYNTTPKKLAMTGYGLDYPENILSPLAVDADGKMVLSPQINIDTAATGLDIRHLNESSDSLSLNENDIDIRNLNGSEDEVRVYSQNFASANDSGTIIALGERIFLPTDVSLYRKNSFYVKNIGGVSVTIFLQIAPVNLGNFYVNDGTSYGLLGGATLVLEPSQFMKFARIRVTALLLANVAVYYFGRT